MKLNLLERLFIVSPVRAWLQKHFEARMLFRMGGAATHATALEVGCGPGFAVDLLYRIFSVCRVDAFDIDAKMVALAKIRNDVNGRSNFWVGNLRSIPTGSDHYDAVFNFGAIHHIVDWRAALREIHRVLKPGGKFYCEEILKRYITHPLVGKLMVHPQQDRFDRNQFVNALGCAGFHVLRSRQHFDLYLWVVAVKKAQS